jgi:outer membrane receptor protein involved in Fe transport
MDRPALLVPTALLMLGLSGALSAQEANPAAAPAADALALEQLPTVQVSAQRIEGPGVSASGTSDYGITADDIGALPAGENTPLVGVLAQMPGVSIDQNQQIHIRDTEGPQFQYQINGILVPLDINTNPPFLSMINPLFVERIDLLDGVLPARYSYATGGVVDIETRQGCTASGSELTLFGGQRETFQPSVEASGCDGPFSYYVTGLYTRSNTAFSSATPGPTPYHDHTNSGQTFGIFSYQLAPATQVSLLLSGAASDNELPNVPGLAPEYVLAGVAPPPSADIESDLNFRDGLAMLALKSSPSRALTIELAYAFHTLTQAFRPDNAGELIYQGVASTTTHRDLDNTLEADLTYRLGSHTIAVGGYRGYYSANIEDDSLVFPVDASGAQTSAVPLSILNDAQALNVLSGVYVNDQWRIDDRWGANFGLRWDRLTGFTNGSQLDPTVNLSYGTGAGGTLHAGFARTFQVPIFQGISPSAPAAFAGTTAGGPPGLVSPLTESDDVWDIGWARKLTENLSLSEDNYYEITRHYLDTGQFSVVPIFAPFNYQDGHIWGSELAVSYRKAALAAYANLTVGRNLEKGVATGQFNFDPDELAYIDSHSIVLDHEPLVGFTTGVSWSWRDYRFAADGLFSSGLRGGFANEQELPKVYQLDLSAERTFHVPGLGTLVNRLTLVNALDRINLIRPAEGIGIFQAAYGPRRTIYDSLTIPF